MSEAAGRPRNAFIGVVASWVLALATALVIGFVVDELQRAPWLVLGFALVVVVSFAIQLWYAAPVGFIFRVAASAAGALVVMALVSGVFGVVALLRS